MQHTRIACTVCGKSVARSEAVVCAGCELVYFCGRACADCGTDPHRAECEVFKARIRKMSPDERFLWHLNRGVLLRLIWPAFVTITTLFPRPLTISDNAVLLITFNGPLTAFGRSKEEASYAIQHHLFVALSRLTNHFGSLNSMLSTAGEGTAAARPFSHVRFMSVRAVSDEEARAVGERDCSLHASALSNWIRTPRGRVMALSSIDDRKGSSSVTLAAIE